MYLKQFAIIILGLIMLAGCQEAKKGNDEPQNKQTKEPQQVNPGQQMPQTNAGEITDEELEKFVAINKKMQKVNQDMQQKMTKVIEDNGMDMNQFNQIQQSQQNPDSEVDISEDQMNQYRAIMKEMRKNQTQVQEEAQKLIQNEGLTMERYQQIRNKISNNPEMQNKLREMQ